jgi:uridine kinase
MYECLAELYNGKPTKTPVYSFKTNAAEPGQFKTLHPSPIIIFEGILSMYDPRIRNMFDLKIFVNLDLDLALARRILRDIEERGRDVQEVLHRFHTFVKKDYVAYVKGQMAYANIIIPGGNNNESELSSRN